MGRKTSSAAPMMSKKSSRFTGFVSRRSSVGRKVYGEVVGSDQFHIGTGPRKQAHKAHAGSGTSGLASFMFYRGTGEQAQRLLEIFRRWRYGNPAICLCYLRTISVLGAGGFGKVLKVEDVQSGESYAMKIQLKTMATKQAVREAEALNTHRHRFIVDLAHIFNMATFYGILMEFCETDLNKRILTNSSGGVASIGGLEEKFVARYTVCIMLALEFLHVQKVVFRDLKPENVLITALEKGDYAKLTDFGLARSVEDLINASPVEDRRKSAMAYQPKMTCKAGTLAFMSEEALDDDQEELGHNMHWYAARDWYGLGCCLLLMVLGERGGRRIAQGKREVLLPARQSEILRLSMTALDNELITDDMFDVITSLTKSKVAERGGSSTLHSAPFLQNALKELAPKASKARRRVSVSHENTTPRPGMGANSGANAV